jgi:hypothetical protein
MYYGQINTTVIIVGSVVVIKLDSNRSEVVDTGIKKREKYPADVLSNGVLVRMVISRVCLRL